MRGLLARLNVVHVADSPVLDMLHMLYAGLCSTEGGWGELITFLTTLRQGPRNLLLLLTMLHMLAYAQQGGWGGAHNVLDDFETGSTELTVRPPMHRHLELAFESAV